MGGETSVQNVRVRERVSSLGVNKNQVILSGRQQRMSRNNVFKLSGNMALGGADNYPSNDFENIKNSLKLLKSKQSQKRPEPTLEPTNVYSGSYSSNAAQRQPPVPRNLGGQDYQNYGYQQSQPSRNLPQSHKDLAYQAEQHYPSDYPPKQQGRRNNPNEYQQYTPNERPKPNPRAQKQQEYKQPPQDYRREERQDYRREERQEYRGSGQQRGGGGFEDKSIKEINRENRVQIQEYDPSQLVQCTEGCGRKFNPDSIAKHEAVCRKVFQQKRKQFNAQDQRLVQKEQKKLMKRGEVVQRKLQEKKAREKVPKWKAESLQLRAGIKQARSDDYVPTKEQQRVLQQARNSGMVKCQYCGRSFNEQASIKHIPFCESQQKKNQIRRR